MADLGTGAVLRGLRAARLPDTGKSAEAPPRGGHHAQAGPGDHGHCHGEGHGLRAGQLRGRPVAGRPVHREDALAGTAARLRQRRGQRARPPRRGRG